VNKKKANQLDAADFYSDTALYSYRSKLRLRAETIAQEKGVQVPENLNGLSSEEVRSILYDLQVHQIELELQNKELRQTQAELEASRALYFDLFDLAPVGYCTISENGLILVANLNIAHLLVADRSELAGQPLTRFILPEDQDAFYLQSKKLFKTQEPQTCELRMLKKDGTNFWAHLAGVFTQVDSASICRLAISDITHHMKVLAKITR
jgi:PAS domain S-box-containing protein